MNDEQFAHRVERTARAFPYPPTPDIAFAPRARQPARRPLRRFAWAAVIVVAVFFGMLAIEPVRAAVLEVLRIGGVEVWIGGAPPTPLPLPTNLLDLAGATTLEAARAAVDFPLRLPPDFPPPDYVFVQRGPGQMVIMAWTDPDAPDRVATSLFQIGGGVSAQKMLGEGAFEQTEVNGQPALWTTAPHVVRFIRDGQPEEGYALLVEGHALIWAEGGVTYRLETRLPLREAIALAEALR